MLLKQSKVRLLECTSRHFKKGERMEAKDIVKLNILTHFILEGLSKASVGIYQGRLKLFDKILMINFFLDEVSIKFYINDEEFIKELDFKDLNIGSLNGIDNMILEIFDEAKRGSNA